MIPVTQINTASDTWQDVIDRLNRLSSLMTSNVVTGDASAGGSVTTGNVTVNGVVTGVTFFSGNSTVNTYSNATTFIAKIGASAYTSINGGEVFSLNATASSSIAPGVSWVSGAGALLTLSGVSGYVRLSNAIANVFMQPGYLSLQHPAMTVSSGAGVGGVMVVNSTSNALLAAGALSIKGAANVFIGPTGYIASINATANATLVPGILNMQDNAGGLIRTYSLGAGVLYVATSTGANLFYAAASATLTIGNNTANSTITPGYFAFKDSTTLQVAGGAGGFSVSNATQNVIIRPGSMNVGTQTSMGATGVITNGLAIGNSTQNTFVNSTGFYVNGSSIGGAPSELDVRGALANLQDTAVFSKQIQYAIGANNTDTDLEYYSWTGNPYNVWRFMMDSSGNLRWYSYNANGVQVNAILSVYRSGGVYMPGSLQVGSTINLASSGLFMGQVQLGNTFASIGNSTVNAYVNSTCLGIGNSTVWTNATATEYRVTSPGQGAVLLSTGLLVGSRVSVNTSGYYVNSGSNSFTGGATSAVFSGASIGTSELRNTGFFAGNATANVSAAPSAIAISSSAGSVTVAPAGVTVGNSTVNVAINSSSIYMGGVPVAWRKASNSDVWSATADRTLTTELIETASAPVTLTDGATVTPDWDTFINGSLTMAGNRTLANPTNVQPGTMRTIMVMGNNSAARTLSFGSSYRGTLPSDTVNSTSFLMLGLLAYNSTWVVVSSARAS